MGLSFVGHLSIRRAWWKNGDEPVRCWEHRVETINKSRKRGSQLLRHTTLIEDSRQTSVLLRDKSQQFILGICLAVSCYNCPKHCLYVSRLTKSRGNLVLITMFLILRKPRAPWSLLRAILSKRQYFKRDVETATYPVEKSDKCNNAPAKDDPQFSHLLQAPDIQVTHTARRDTLCSCDTEAIVDQLAALATTVSHSSHSATEQSKRSTSSLTSRTSTTVSAVLGGKGDEEEESFHYLRSLITVSSLPQQSSDPSPCTSADEKDTQKTGRKRASSRLSLRLGDLPGLSFPSKVSRKPCPRYSPLPPVWTPKTIAMRPAVRF